MSLSQEAPRSQTRDLGHTHLVIPEGLVSKAVVSPYLRLAGGTMPFMRKYTTICP
jgi:hypothetical protein